MDIVTSLKTVCYMDITLEFGVTMIKGWEVFVMKGSCEAGRVESTAVSELELLLLSGSPVPDPYHTYNGSISPTGERRGLNPGSRLNECSYCDEDYNYHCYN